MRFLSRNAAFLLLGTPLLFQCGFILADDDSGSYAPQTAASPVVPASPIEAQPKMTEIEGLRQAGKKSEADKALSKWTDSEKKSPWPLVLAAQFRFEERKYGKVVSLAQKAIDLSPQCAEAYYWKGRAYEMQKKPLDAANELRAALLLKDNDPVIKEAVNRVNATLDKN